MRWQDLSKEFAPRLQGNLALADQRPFIYIELRQQRLDWIDIETENNRSFPVSTAKNGMGNRIEA